MHHMIVADKYITAFSWFKLVKGKANKLLFEAPMRFVSNDFLKMVTPIYLLHHHLKSSYFIQIFRPNKVSKIMNKTGIK